MDPTKHKLVMAVLKKMMANELLTHAELARGASDASASDDGLAYGWLSDWPEADKHRVWWFHYQMLEKRHPSLSIQGQEAQAPHCSFERFFFARRASPDKGRSSCQVAPSQ